MLTAMPQSLGSNPVGSMGVCKCIVPLQHWDTLNSHRAASLLVMLLEEEGRGENLITPLGCSPSKVGWNRAKMYIRLNGAQTTGVYLALCGDEFRGPRSDIVI
ncbi:hypothetical protein TNCV_4762621 [Trichonephila clavipes]|nr:hypothetical protein TNCV_4762621 [Trichonephila clavipes]